jgi:hypothetical protein
MNKRIRIGVLGAILTAGTLVGVTQVGGVANAQVDTVVAAQTDDTPPTDTAPTDDATQAEREAEREARQAAREADRQAVADLLGVDIEDLKTQLKSGTTLAGVATANGVEVSAVVELIVQQKTARIDEAVADGRITAEQASERTADLQERVQTRVEEGRPERGEGRRGGHGRGGPDAAEPGDTPVADPPVADAPVATDAGS